MPQYQVKFFTKQEQYAVPDTPFDVENVKPEQLSLLIKKLLETSGTCTTREDLEFDFLINGELLRLSLGDFLEAHEISPENLIEIEYIEKCPPPDPIDGLEHEDWVSAVAASDSLILTGCYDSNLTLWSFDGERKLVLPGHRGAVKAVCWLDTEDLVYSFISASSDETALMWQLNSETNSVETVHVCKGHNRSVECICVDPSKSRFATGSYDTTLKIWSTKFQRILGDPTFEGKKSKTTETTSGHTRVPIMTFAGHNEAITGIEWPNQGEVITCSMDHSIRVWDLEAGGFKSQMTAAKAFLDISVSPINGMVISAQTDRHIRLWDSRSKEGFAIKQNYTSHTGWVTSVYWSRTLEHQFISGSHDTTMLLWDQRSPKSPLYVMEGHTGNVMCVNWSQPQWLLSGSADNYLKIYKHPAAFGDSTTEK